MARRRNGELIYRTADPVETDFLPTREGEQPREDLTNPLGAAPQPAGQGKQRGPARASRGALYFDTEAGPAEQTYMDELGKPEPEYNRPARAHGWKRFGGEVLMQMRATQGLGKRIAYGEVDEAKEDFGQAVGLRARRLDSLGKGAALEVKRRGDRNTNLWRTADLNVKFARNDRERSLLPYRMRNLESQIGRNDSAAGASKALERMRDRNASGKRSPFKTMNPGQGIFNSDTGDVSRNPNPSEAALARPRAGGKGAVTPYQVQMVERKKQDRLDAHGKLHDTELAKIDRESDGISPTLDDGSPNPMYDRPRRLEILKKWDKARKEEIERAYRNELDRLGMRGDDDPYEYDTEEGGEPQDDQDLDGDSMTDDDLNGEANWPAGLEDDFAMSGGSSQESEGSEEEPGDQMPIGTIYHNPGTGQRIRWTGSQWVDAESGRLLADQ
jgi:hypothetical protein